MLESWESAPGGRGAAHPELRPRAREAPGVEGMGRRPPPEAESGGGLWIRARDESTPEVSSSLRTTHVSSPCSQRQVQG